MENNLKKYLGASLWENGKNIIADVNIADDVNLILCNYEERIRLLQVRNKELENEVDYVKLNSGYVAFMESQARIKELEKENDKLMQENIKLGESNKAWKDECKKQEDDNAALKKSALDYCDLNDKYEVQIKELEEEKKRLGYAYNEIRDDWAADERILIKIQDAMKEYRE